MPDRGRPDIRVLVVEDDPTARDGILATLRGVFEVVGYGAGDGEEAFSRLVAVKPDLILCDLRMPRLDGFGFVRRLRRDPRYHRILTIAVSGRGRPIDLAATREAGFDGHVLKPLTAATLARLLDRAWDTRNGGCSSESVT